MTRHSGEYYNPWRYIWGFSAAFMKLAFLRFLGWITWTQCQTRWSCHVAKTHGSMKGRNDRGRYISLPHSVLDSESFTKLSGNALKVLIRIFKQYNGRNNGDLCAPFSYAKELGIGSQSTWYKAVRELVDADLIMCTRDSRKKGVGNPHGLCALYAVTWLKIDECNGKLDCSPTIAPPRKFSLIKGSLSSAIKNEPNRF